MKLIKKFLIISFFSLLFIINVNAADFNDYAIPGYSEEQLSIIQSFKDSDKYNQIIDYIRNNLTNHYIFNTSYDLTDNSLILFDISSLDTNTIIFHIYTENDFAIDNSRNASLKLVSFYIRSRNSQGATFNANFANDNLQSVSNVSNGAKSMYFTIETTETNYFVYPDNRGTFNASYIDDTFISDDYTALFSISTPIYVDGTLYSQYGNYNVKDFVDYMNRDLNVVPANPNKCLISNQIGTTRNISSLTFRVIGTTNALDYPLEGFFDISTRSFLNNTAYDWKTFVNVVVKDIQSDDEYDVDYTLDWITGTTSDYLRLNYKITAIDDIDTNVDVSFTLTSRDVLFDPFFENELLIYGCPPKNIYSNISYGYTDNDSGISYSSDSVLSNWLQDNSVGNISPLINTDLIGEGPVDSILLLPLNIMQNLLSVLNSNTCQPLVLPLPHLNRNITLPCINTLYSQINGLSTFLDWFSTIMSAFILYEYFIRLYKWVDNLLTFRENNHFGGF